MARGSNIILLCESHVSLLTMSSFVKDMVNDYLVVQSLKSKNQLDVFWSNDKSNKKNAKNHRDSKSYKRGRQ